MARFITLCAIAGEGGYRKFPALTTIADTIGNAQYGDTVWSALCKAPSGANLAPLDSAAFALMGGCRLSPSTRLAATAVKMQERDR